MITKTLSTDFVFNVADVLRASYINDPERNPYLTAAWDPDKMERMAESVPEAVFGPWIKLITHLQRYSWRFHVVLCEDPICPGCAEESIANHNKVLTAIPEGVELRLYWHKKQCEFLVYEGREGWLITGRRFGKTEVAVFWLVCNILGYNPLTNKLSNVPITAWLVGLDFPMIRDALVPMFRKLMPDEHTKWSDELTAWDFRKTDLIANLFNGSIVGFKSADSGPSKFQSVGLDILHFDEEPPEDVYREAKLRIKAGKLLRIRGSMTPDPTMGLTWTYKKILKNEKRLANPRDLRIWTGGTRENPGMTEESIDFLIADLEVWERSVMLEGHYDVGRGRGAFNADQLIEMNGLARDPMLVEPFFGAELCGWEDPIPGCAYIVSGDPAEGLDRGDNSSAHVLRRDTMSVVATFCGKPDPDLFGRGLVALAKTYNDAHIICEANNHGFTTIRTIQDLGYTNLYSEKSIESLGMVESRRMGWYTNIITRPILVDGLAKAIRDGLLSCPDTETIDEMLTFIVNAKGKAEAQHGCKDDRVLSLGLAVQGHLRCSMPEAMLPIPVPEKKSWWDMDVTNPPNLGWMAS